MTTDKDRLRAQLRAARSAMTPEERVQASSAIAAHVMAGRDWAEARTVAVYVASPSEVHTRALRQVEDKRIVLPRVSSEAAPLTFHTWRGPLERWRSIRQPPAHAPIVHGDEIDLVLLPAVGVDPRGNRLGQGGGYYDRTLRTLLLTRRVALVYACQVVPEVATGRYDVPVHAYATEDGYFLPPA